MASAQVLSTSRKQEHLEAGKRRLEEFRKKKAAERAKKSTSVSQSQASDVRLHDKQGLEADRMRVTDSDGVGTSDRPDKAVRGTTLVLNNDDSKLTELSMQNQQGLLNDRHANPFSSVNDLNSSSIDLARTYSNNQAIKIHGASGPVEQVGTSNNLETKDVNNDFVHSRGQDRPQYGSMSDQLFGLRPQASQDYDNGSSKSSFQGIEEPRLTENDSFFKVSAVHSDSSNEFVTQISPQNSITTPLQSKPSTAGILGNGRTFYSSSKDSTQPTTSARGSVLEVGKNMQGVANSSVSVVSDSDETKLSNSASGFPSLYNGPVQTSKSSGFSFDVTSSYNHVPMHSAANEFTSRRSRPSFLDSLDIPRASSGSPFQRTEPPKESFMSNSSDLNSMDVLGSSAAQKPLAETETMEPFSTSITSNAPSAFNDVGNFSVSVNNRADLLRPGTNENSKEMKHAFYSTKQNEDFAALEQHIEDLTQEKFTLQRSLEASQALAQSLAAENSSLTDNYNQQRSVVNQLKSDMEKLQEEIKAQLVELESFRDEYTNARLECSAADERAKILASEVIGLEEKALRLRSSELKLERQLENSQAEISSYKKKVSSIEKERKDLQLTIDALQEEKKVLQSKVRKASGSMQSTEMNKNPTTSRKDMSTSTEDLDTTLDNKEVHDNSSSLESDASGLPLLPGNGLLALDVSAVNIPPDQMRMIQNINALISELSLEKEELIQALSSELSQSSKLKDLNNELSRKLEAQTQRLELLTAQNMVTEHVSTRQSDSRVVHDNVAYADADEGDEVVERVLGWIMKLFPGGPSRRRTSKLL